MLICIFSVTSVSASDLNATDDVIAVEDTVDVIGVNEKTEILSTNYTPKTFDEIQTAVDSASDGDTVILDGYYRFNSTIEVNKQLNFVGINNATVDGNNTIRLFTAFGNNISFKDITFKNGKSNMGAAIQGSSNVNVFDCTFVNNSASNGGALYLCNSYNCIFINNSAESDGGAVVGLYYDRYYQTNYVLVENCTFFGNKANMVGPH